ncbi:MAG TPA: lysoplasmalogenase family protein [Mycobacteriales bacterium]
MHRQGLAAAVAVADVLLAGSRAPWARRARWVTKPALVPAIAAAVPARPPALALGASWAGDVALLSRSDAGLLGGIAGFAVAHAAYLTRIFGLGPAGSDRPDPAGPAIRWPVEAAAGAAVWAAAGHVLWRRLDTDAERRLRLPVLGYAALVTAMGAAAVRAGRRRRDPALAAGGVVFVVSDGLVAASLFGPQKPAVDAAVMATYAAAQTLLARALATGGVTS